MISALRTVLFAACLLLLPATAIAGDFTDKQKDEIGAIVRDYLLRNPEILLDVSRELDKRQQAAEDQKRKSAVAENAKEIFRSAADFATGNPQGDVTIVEFFDYNCPWCKKSAPIIQKLLKDDKGVKLVFKEFPILGEGSEYAARAAIAAKMQGKYLEFHTAMYAHAGKIDAAVVDGVAQSLGLDMAKLKTDMESTETVQIIDRNRNLAQTLGINGTPGFVINQEVIPGFLTEPQMADSIRKVRDTGACAVC
ncbi:MAG: DsbA family protein [Rhizobiales bacterium]|nr:DsbA family protein [Hyphomicrobiales bacterium]MBI3673697.1 DsbA family protein [Hyphomicrobiales bacterium]